MNRTLLLTSLALASAAGLAAGTLPARTAVLGTAVGAQATPPAAAAKAYTVDAVHSAVLFRVKHLNTSWSYGRFNAIAGTFLLDGATPANSSIDVTIQAESIDTASEGRDKHLRSPDFFSSKEFPTITFKSTSVKKVKENTFEVVGDLTLRGVKKSITTTIEQTGAGPGMRGGEIAGLHTTFTVKRSEFGMNYMPQGLGEDVEVTVSLEGGR